MRYYSIEIEGGKTYTSFSNGKTIPGALNVELDIPVIAYDLPMGAALVRIWGISLAEIGQASDLNNKNVKVYAGFQKGLPLANPAQAGIIVQGYIFQAYGNWINTDQTLDLLILAGSAPGSGKTQQPARNLAFNWKAGTLLKDAVNTTLTTAYPGFTVDINIDSKLVLPQDAPGYYTNLTQFAQYIRAVSRGIIGGETYQGVSITLQEKKFTVFDGTAAAKGPKQIDFKDLIGQPTWINAPSIQLKCAMRADLKVGDVVKLPKTQVTNSAQAQTSLVNQKVAFQGDFQISVLRHVGNFRQADASAWVTVIDAFPTTQKAA